jgi:SAM-dependent methyltransferase
MRPCSPCTSSRRLGPFSGRPSVIEPVLTGERTWPDIPRETYWFMRHLACYRWAAYQLGSDKLGADQLGADPAGATAGKTTQIPRYPGETRQIPRYPGETRQIPRYAVLDAGSGEGYGAAEISRLSSTRIAAPRVTAVELDAATAGHARNHYPGVDHVRANLIALPFADGSFHSAVSLQVIEHIWDPVTYLRELDRCTSGPIVISTPNRPVHSPHVARGERPANPFHVREYDAEELRESLLAVNSQRTPLLFGLHHGPRIAAWEHAHGALPDALLAEEPAAAAFAHGIDGDDFVIAPLQADDDPRVHDLVALW